MCGKVTDDILDIFLENFSQLEGTALRAKYKRPGMVNYFNALIRGYCNGEDCNPQQTCRDVIVAILRYHERCMDSNWGVCMMGKHHNVLHVAIKLCYHWQLKDNSTVIDVLAHIYLCEKTFESIWIGALVGIRKPYFAFRWNNDYEDQEDNFRAVFYLLDHATNAGLKYSNENGEMIRYIDVPFKTSGFTPLTVVLLFGLPNKALMLLRYGATFDNHMFHIMFNDLVRNQRSYSYNLIACLRFMLRASSHKYMIELRKENPEGFNILIEDSVIPLPRCGVEPSSLKHLCRCSIRERLRQNNQLPKGIKMLEIPQTLHKYLDLLID